MENGFLITVGRFIRTRQLIAACLLSLCFLGALHFFLKSHSRHALCRDRVRAAATQLKRLEDKKSAMERQAGHIARTGAFLDKAEQLGLTRSKWAFYDVFIQESLFFSELTQILNQCTHAPTHYFKPETLHIKLTDKAGPKPKNKTPPPAMEKDLRITLKGTYITPDR